MSQQDSQKTETREAGTQSDDNARYDPAVRLVAMIEATMEYAECLLRPDQRNPIWHNSNDCTVPKIYLEAPPRLEGVLQSQKHRYTEAGRPVLVISALGVDAEAVSEKAFAIGMSAAQSAVRDLYAAVFDSPASTDEAS